MGKLGAAALCLVFAIPFGGVGVFATWAIGSTLHEAWRARDWVRVRATVDEASLSSSSGSDGGTTFRADGRYRYVFEGRPYSGSRLGISRLGGSDNIDDWHEQTSARLADARAAGLPVTVWVNPDNPAESVFDRELRWGEVLFLVPFSLAFGGVGVGALVAMYFVLRGKGGQGGANEAVGRALGAPSRQGASGGDSSARFLWVFAFFWNSMSWPIAFLAVPDIVERGEWMGLLVLLFPLVGLGLLWAAISVTWSAFVAKRRGTATPPPARARSAPGAFAERAARAMFDPQGGSPRLRPPPATSVAIPESLAAVEESGGTLTLRYSRRRNLGLGIALLVTGGVLSAIGAAILAADGIGLAAAALLAIGGLVDVSAVATMVKSLAVTVSRSELVVEKSGLFGRRAWRAGRDEIVALKVGNTHSVNDVPYFALHAVDRGGQRIPVGDGVRGTDIADSLAQRIGRALGLDPSRIGSAGSPAADPSGTGDA